MFSYKTSAAFSAAFATAAGLAIIAGGSSASAHGMTEKISTEVSYSDLNLSTDKGVERLQRRVKAAADKVCGRPSRDLVQTQHALECRKAALAKAHTDIQVAIAEQGDHRQMASLGTSKVIGVSKQ